MDLSNLKPAAGATKTRTRIGRGEGTGKGGTSTKGHKGQKSRSGYSKKVGFEGGQMPLQRRVPKFGFKSLNRVEYKAINLETLQELADAHKLTKIDQKVLMNAGLVTEKHLVTTTRNDVRWVITEYGTANLQGKSLTERAKLLIHLAAPQFREGLEKDFWQMRKTI